MFKTLSVRPSREVLNDLYTIQVWPASRIARKYKVSKQLIYNWMDKYEIPTRSRGRLSLLTPDHVRIIRMLADAGMNAKMIIEKLDDLPRPVSDKTVYDVIAWKTWTNVV